MIQPSRQSPKRIHQKDWLEHLSQDTGPVGASGALRGQPTLEPHTGLDVQASFYSRPGLAAPVGETPPGPSALLTPSQTARSGERDAPWGGGGYMSSLLRPPAIMEAISRGEATDATLQRLDEALYGSEKGDVYGYPEHLAKPSTLSNSKGFNGSFDMPCPGYVTVGECESGHMFARELVCGREWCPHCGQTGGISHSRRKARWYPKGVQIGSMGYFVFTLPPELRWKYRSQKALSALGVAFRRMLQRHGYPRGLRGWDWFGEQENAPEGESPRWHPHYSALVDGAYLDKAKLKLIRRSVSRILGVRLSRVNVYYQYSIETARKLHWLNYVTRPTFLDWRWDSEMAVTLRGFRTYQAWGRWEDSPAWDIPSDDTEGPQEAVSALERGFCPSCGSELSWGKARASELVSAPGWEGLGSGYWKYKGPHT